MGAQKAAWNVAFKSETAALSKEVYASSLLDIVKCFETVPHEPLVRAARKHNYNLFVLRLSLDAYRSGRTIVINGTCSRIIIAVCSITAGSGFATSELRVLLLDVIDSTYKIWSGISLAVFVDDFTADAAGTESEVTRLVVGATAHIIHCLEVDLEMEVSESKSVVVCSSVRLALNIQARTSMHKVSVVRTAKILGAPHGGGARRCVKPLRSRINVFRDKIDNIQAVRAVGVHTHTIVRAAGTPAITYGVEVMGMSDTHLEDARRSIAQAAAPERGGKDYNLVLYVLDGLRGTLDPAFDAHVLPVLFYCQCWWEQWHDTTYISQSFNDATAKLQGAKRSFWDMVSGPIAAMIASLKRLKWLTPYPDTLVDDTGYVYKVRLDPPVVIAEGVRRSVRRWRLARVLEKYPSIMPSSPDYFAPTITPEFLYEDGLVPQGVIDCVSVVSRLLGKSGFKSKQFEPWTAMAKPSLLSAYTGGQWTQSRLASAHSTVDDTFCQLCKSETGTLAHRRRCPATMPTGGWPSPYALAAKFHSTLDACRANTALDRGLCIGRIIVPPPPFEASFVWLLNPPDVIPPRAVWYIDGSLIHAKFREAARTGFAIVIVDADGSLLAYGNGSPPNWIQDAAGAEVWALYVTLSLNIGCPLIVTDCFNILTFLQQGFSIATASNRPLARVWNLIAAVFDHEPQHSLANSLIVWMPAHCTPASIGVRIKSNGKCVTAIDWRANRLVDILAKTAARVHAVPDLAVDVFDQVHCAAEFYAAQVGVVTHAANNLRVQVTRKNGAIGFTTLRDTLTPSRPKRKFVRLACIDKPLVTSLPKRRKTELLVPNSAASKEKCFVNPPSASALAASKTRVHGAAYASKQESLFQAWFHENRVDKPVRPPTVSADDRMKALRRRALVVGPKPNPPNVIEGYALSVFSGNLAGHSSSGQKPW